MITSLLFDFFDVIRVDPYKKWLADNNYKREGYWYDAAADYDRGIITREEFIELLSKESGQSADDINTAFRSTNIFDDDVIDLITRAGDAYKVGLLSNSGGPGLRKLMKEKDLEKLFHEIVISGEVGFIKPEKEIFEIGLQRLDCSPRECVFIDDNPHNVEAAIEIGVNGIIFTSAPQLVDALVEFDVKV